jgi:hypothetical protein
MQKPAAESVPQRHARGRARQLRADAEIQRYRGAVGFTPEPVMRALARRKHRKAPNPRRLATNRKDAFAQVLI